MAVKNLSEITVVICSYHYAHLASHCVESVLAQTLKPTRILLVDDGAHDGIEQIADRYGIQCLIRPENLGIARNFDDIVRHIETERAMLLGADNYLRPDALELLSKHDADIVSSDIALVGDNVEEWLSHRPLLKIEYQDGYPIWRFEKKDINKDNYIHGSSLFNASMVHECRGNNINGGCVDWEMWKDIINAGGTHIHVPEPLLYYRRHKANFSRA